MLSTEVLDVALCEWSADQLWGGNIESPQAGSHYPGQMLNLIGWVLGRRVPVVAVEIISDGHVLQRMQLNVRRPDVAACYPEASPGGRSGFQTVLSIKSPELEFLVQAVLQDHYRVPIGRFRTRCNVAGSPGPGNDTYVPVGEVSFGVLRRVVPISPVFGFDRGQPIDRYYIEKFLTLQAGHIRGRVLEIGDNAYTEKYGGSRVSKGDVLHVTEGNPQATIVADLTSADHVPSDSFDCIILTQTLQCVYDVKAAIRTLWRILKPGGVLLATFPGITKISHRDWGYTWYWNFTALSARRLLEEVFPSDHVEIHAHGNVLAATALLQGLAAEELRLEELEYRDPDYEVLLTLKAVKPESHGAETAQIRATHSTAASTADIRQRQALILLYHRVADLPSDPWLLGVTPQHFSEHLEIIRQRAHPISLQQLSESSSGSILPERAVAITFDDCYADYLYEAKPRLGRFGIRATTFIVAGYIECRQEFWWDELDRLLLQPGTLPEVLRLDIGGTQYEWILGAAARYSESEFAGMRTWRAWEAAPTARHELYRSLWELMHPLAEQERHKVLDVLRTWAGAGAAARPSHRLLSADELRALADGDLVEIGAHTMSHPALATLSASAQWDEIQQSKNRLEDVLGRPVSSFAYPFGRRCDYLPETVSIVRDVGFARACSNFPGVVEQSTDRFQLPRVQVQDWDGEEFSRRLERWFEE